MNLLAAKRKLLVLLFALYVTFILISTVPYLAEQNILRNRASTGTYESHLLFPANGTYGHYKNVVLLDGSYNGKIDLKYRFDSNTLFIERIENVKELSIDCKLMYENKCQEVFENDPKILGTNYYKTYFVETTDGIFTVIINSNTPMEKLTFLDSPMPSKVVVNNKDWWEIQTGFYDVDDSDITITYIPQGLTTVKISFTKESTIGINPIPIFNATKYLGLKYEDILFDASESYDEDGEIIDYLWDFGDGREGSGHQITHTYTELGEYVVTLTVRDNDYLEANYSRTISIVQMDTDIDNDEVPDYIDPNPLSKLDSDADGLSDDYEEMISLTFKYVRDTDGDGLSDYEEIFTYFTNPFSRDSDRDGFIDSDEIEANTNPNSAASRPSRQKEEDEFGIIYIVIIIIVVIIILIVFIFITKPFKWQRKRKHKKRAGKLKSKKGAKKHKGYKKPEKEKPKIMPDEIREMVEEIMRQKESQIFKEFPTTAQFPTRSLEFEPIPPSTEKEEGVIYQFECPDCRKVVPHESIVCPNCGCEFEE